MAKKMGGDFSSLFFFFFPFLVGEKQVVLVSKLDPGSATTSCF